MVKIIYICYLDNDENHSQFAYISPALKKIRLTPNDCMLSAGITDWIFEVEYAPSLQIALKEAKKYVYEEYIQIDEELKTA